MKEYRLVGKQGPWGDIVSESFLDTIESDLAFCNEQYAGQDEFHIEERDVSEWKEVEA